MDLVGMEIFARVVEAKSFSAAAIRLGISKSAVSKHLTNMEKAMGVRLLNRSTRSLSLTEIGKEFYERCALIVVHAEEAEAAAAHLQAGPRGTLKVNVPVSFGVLHIARLLPDLLAAHPELRVEMTLNDRTVNLVEEGYDAAVVIERRPNPGLVARRLAPIRHQLCATPEYFRRHGIPEIPGQLVAHNCLVYSRLGTENEWCFERADDVIRIQVGGNLRLNNENAIRQAVLTGLGVALLPTYLVGADLRRGDLCTALSEYIAAETSLYAVYLPNRQLSPKARAFVDFLLTRFGPAPYWDEAI
ncbi:MAG: LysR family transcriptional regulator [Acidobacteriota bacterium]|nr:LysR family transcriptional regulator [Acidobacteriota bacterium]